MWDFSSSFNGHLEVSVIVLEERPGTYHSSLVFFLVGRSGSSWKAGFGGVSSGGSLEDAVRAWKLGFRNREHRSQLQFGFRPWTSSPGTLFFNLEASCSQNSRNSSGTEGLFPCGVFSESFAVRCFLRKFDPSWIRHCERFCDDTQEVVAQAIGRMEIWRRDWEHSYEKELKTTRKQMLRMKAQLEKHYRKIILMEVGEETKREKLEEREYLIKELQERVRHLKLEKHPGFCRSEAF